MSGKATITVLRSREEVQSLWQSSDFRLEHTEGANAEVTFADAPGDRGTEIQVDLGRSGPVAKIGEVAQKLSRSDPRAKVMDELRRFKQLVETGVIARSDGFPEGELAEGKPMGRPAQPLGESDLEKAGV